MAEVDRDGDVWLLNLGAGENRFNPGMISGLNAVLDEIEAASGPRALVTLAEGKFWSTGLDLEWMLAHPGQAAAMLADTQLVLARFLLLPVPTVAAITGHAFGAGAMLGCAHDQAVMRRDRGYWCLPEVDLGLPFTHGMDVLVRARLPVRAAHYAMTSGHRYGRPTRRPEHERDARADRAGICQDGSRERRRLPDSPRRAGGPGRDRGVRGRDRAGLVWRGRDRRSGVPPAAGGRGAGQAG